MVSETVMNRDQVVEEEEYSDQEDVSHTIFYINLIRNSNEERSRMLF